MTKIKRSEMTCQLARQCRALVDRVAKKYGIPPVYVTAHIRNSVADEARFEVWAVMIDDFGMTRQLVADIFGRNRRRLRASVLAKHSPAAPPAAGPARPRRRLPRPKPLPPLPFQPVGNQFVWCFAVPLVLEPRPPAPPVIQLTHFMRPVPEALREKLAAEERLAMARFYERQAKAMRKSVVG